MLALVTGPAPTTAATSENAPKATQNSRAHPGAKPPAKALAKAAPKLPSFEFAVLGNTPFGNTEVPVVRSVLATIGDGPAAFVVHAGNFKGPTESCRDELITERIGLLSSSPKPLIYVPGANDWADCQRATDGSYNPIERLDFLRDRAFGNDDVLGPGPVGHAQFDLTRQSDMARFRQYHENVRWFYRGIVFVGLNLPGNNNNYRSAGGRNGEFEDRVIATRVWLQHALVYAQQKDAQGMVIVVQADPEFEPMRGGGLRGMFSDRNERRGVDGYKDFRVQLQKLASRFKAPILLIDSGKTMHITQPLRDVHGAVVKSFTQVSTYGTPTVNRWVRVRVDPGTAQVFSVDGVMLPANSAAASAQKNTGPTPPRGINPSPETGTGSDGAGPYGPYGAPYSTLYPASGAAINSSDPNQGVTPLGPSLMPSDRPATRAPARDD
ncbi:hypothetical protein AT302_24720 [Pandoraea norimbergensis]|uniref:SGNH hydrolase-type esterase domain-containing protein n=2 Tax=Pandoraea norimbergensis TaxID=93219 RepID=A0ABM5WPI9_9BURK|nr:hypothetical protein AT302_24720 [Pandoraea norimbergensis]